MTCDTTLNNDKIMNVYIMISLFFVYIVYIGTSNARVVVQGTIESTEYRAL